MSILSLLSRVQENINPKPHPFLDGESQEKEAYLAAVVLQALADQRFCEREERHYYKLADAFEVERERAKKVLARASEANEALVVEICSALRDTKYAYYLIVDLQIIAHVDNHLDEREAKVIHTFAGLLGIDEHDELFLVELANAVALRDETAKAGWVARFFDRLQKRGGMHPDAFDHYTH